MFSIKKRIGFLIFTVMLFNYTSLKSQSSAINYEWKQAALGGGGYVTGLLQHPVDNNIVYARCDVGGVFKSIDGGKSWKVINNGMTALHQHSVESFAINKLQPNVLLRCSGGPNDNKLNGYIHKSTDGGKNWRLVSTDIYFGGNCESRWYGEKIQFDPFNKNNVVAAGFYNGVFLSIDEGEHWKYVGLKGEPMGTVAFHPYKDSMLFIATRDHLEHKDYLFPNGGYNRPKVGRIYLSTDKGKSLIKIFEEENLEFYQLAFESNNPNLIYAATSKGVYKSTDMGKSFNLLSNGLVTNFAYNSVTTSPLMPGTIYAAANRWDNPEYESLPKFPLYFSKDYGNSWAVANEYNKNNFNKYPSFLSLDCAAGFAISKIMIDTKNSNKLFTSNWFGVSVSEDAGLTWSGNYHKGTETICGESITCDPNDNSRVYVAMADHSPAFSSDNGVSYTGFSSFPNPENNLNSGAICISKFKKDFVLYSLYGWPNVHDGSFIMSTADNGKTVKKVMQFYRPQFVQAIKEDNFLPGTFYAYIDGIQKDSIGLWVTKDWGNKWIKVPNKFPAYIKTLPLKRDWIETELLPITTTQRKNICGAGQLLCVDPFNKNTLYVGEWTEGIFKITDQNRWESITANLPFHKNKASVLVDIIADEKRKNNLYAGFVREGLWRTEDGGEKWYKIFPKTMEEFNASSVVIGGVSGNEIYIACEPLYYSKAGTSVWHSADMGKTWKNIYDKTLGALRWKSISVDNKTGTIRGITNGNGIFIAKRKSK